MAAKSCGQCKHYERAQKYRFGTCCVPVPKFVTGEDSNVSYTVWADDTEDCDLFTEKQQGEAHAK